MKIEDLVQLLNNRLREFQLSRDYARMNGDLERINVADKEIIDLENTLFKLNLLVDTSKSAAVKEAVLAEVITDGSVAVLGEYDITSYATDPLHEEKIMNILSKMGVMNTVEKIDDYINGKYLSSPVTGEMIMSAASAYNVDARLMMAIMEQDSSFGTAGKAVRTLNPGNVGNNDAGDTVTYESWQAGVTAVAGWLSRHRGSTIIPKIPDTLTTTPTTTTTTSVVTSTTTTSTTTPASPAVAFGEGDVIATSTPETIPVFATSSPSTVTTTPVTVTSTEETPPPVTTSTTTTTTASSTPTTTTTTSPVIPTTPLGINSAEESLSPTTTTTTPTTTTTTSTPVVTPTSTPETIPVVTSTTTTNTTATTTPTE